MSKSGLSFDCPVCGKAVYRYPSEVKRGCTLTCSRKCRAVLQNTGETKECLTCGKSFYARKSQISQGYANYCSKPCSNAPHKTGKDLNCLICGSTMYRTQYEIDNGADKACSFECREKYQKRFHRKGRKRGIKEMFTNWQKREWMDSECAMCGDTELLELDHIIPRFAGGKAERPNAQTLCRTCNRRKYYEVDLPKYDNLRELAKS